MYDPVVLAFPQFPIVGKSNSNSQTTSFLMMHWSLTLSFIVKKSSTELLVLTTVMASVPKATSMSNTNHVPPCASSDAATKSHHIGHGFVAVAPDILAV